MRADLHDRMLDDIAELRKVLARASSVSTISNAFAILQDVTKAFRDYHLTSPQKQMQYLIGLMLTTPEPHYLREMTDEEWKRALELSENIFESYALMFWPGVSELSLARTEAWIEPRSVVMPVFLHYLGHGTLATVDQLVTRIRSTIVPFDQELLRSIGISASDILRIVVRIESTVQKAFDECSEFFKAVAQLRDRHFAEGWSGAKARRVARTDPIISAYKEAPMRFLLQFEFKDIESLVGPDAAKAFWSCLVSVRSGDNDFTYPTDDNPFGQKPFVQIGDGSALAFVTNPIYEAVLNRLSRVLMSDEPTKVRFLKLRDTALEEHVARTAIAFFGDDAEVYENAYEQADSQFEHDLIVIWNRSLFVFESKATPPSEPFRDPNKAYERLRRSFKGSGGIQKAFNQGDRIRLRLKKAGRVDLYDAKGKLLRSVIANEIDEAYCICVSADTFGPVAVKLDTLLEKDPDAPYPWAVCVFDLEAMLDAFRRKQWGPEYLRDFLLQRRELQGKAFTDDELEIAGAFILYGSLRPWIDRPERLIFFKEGFSKVFDDIFNEDQGGAPAKLTADGPPQFVDYKAVRNALVMKDDSIVPVAAGLRRDGNHTQSQIRVGRNDPCPCGSGRKFKRCCHNVNPKRTR